MKAILEMSCLAYDPWAAKFSRYCDKGYLRSLCLCLPHCPLTPLYFLHSAQVSAACLLVLQVLGPKPHHVVCNSMLNRAGQTIVLFFFY